MNYSDNLKLNKPTNSDTFSIDHQNANMDIIDEKITELEETTKNIDSINTSIGILSSNLETAVQQLEEADEELRTDLDDTANSLNALKEIYGESYISLGRTEDSTVGNNSIAFGTNNTASGNSSLAIGEDNVVSGNMSYVFGGKNTSSCDYNFVTGQENSLDGIGCNIEGYNNSLSGGNGKYCHIEGDSNTVSLSYYATSSHIEGSGNSMTGGSYNHIEGCYNSTEMAASGTVSNSHIEGSNNFAKAGSSYIHIEGSSNEIEAQYSHIEGYNNICHSDYQHIEGCYNIADNENKYLHIIGNGNYETRSNAFTVDWDGNGEFSGDVKTTSGASLNTLKTQVEECFHYVSDGKSLVASAITDKGVQTAADATFETMANNIAMIESGSLSDGAYYSLGSKTAGYVNGNYVPATFTVPSDVTSTDQITAYLGSGSSDTNISLGDISPSSMTLDGTSLSINLLFNEPPSESATVRFFIKAFYRKN